jgi:hypothetical protein
MFCLAASGIICLSRCPPQKFALMGQESVFLVVYANEMVNGSAPIAVIEYIRGIVIQVHPEIEVRFVRRF